MNAINIQKLSNESAGLSVPSQEPVGSRGNSYFLRGSGNQHSTGTV